MTAAIRVTMGLLGSSSTNNSIKIKAAGPRRRPMRDLKGVSTLTFSFNSACTVISEPLFVIFIRSYHAMVCSSPSQPLQST
jgi:hypothetical protein